MTPGLHIHLLGEFGLTFDGARVTAVNSPRLRALLAYLILHRGAPQSRQHLAFLLWPDSTEEQARTNLRNLVHLLRHALPHSDCCLHCEGQVLVWEPHVPYILDTAEFEAAVEEGAHQRAIEMYRGQLLPECYGDWVAPERDRYHRLYIAALERLVQQLEDARDYQAALGYAQRLAREDPLCEGYCRHLIRLQMLAGDRAAALRTYHACATGLRHELGVEPAPATQQLYLQALHGAAPAAELRPGPAEENSPLVGRRREWLKLLRVWQSAASGRPQLALITGDVGIGKTRLAEELLAWVGHQGYPAARAACYAAESSLPYGPILIWLRSRPVPTLPEPWRREVSRVLSKGPGSRRHLAASWERHRLFEALAHAVYAWGRSPGCALGRVSPAGTPAAEPLPILLVLDDLLWCDHDTLDWLHFLLRFDARGRLLVVGTIRSGDPAENRPLALLIDSLHRYGTVSEIDLAPLDRQEVSALASHIAGRPLEPAVAEALGRASEGNPLFVVEMVRAGLGRPGPWDLQHGESALQAGQPLPLKIQQVLRARLAQLSPAALEVAELAAVIGGASRYTVLAHACGSDEASLVQALDELCCRRILREATGDSYDFTHEKLREACYDAMSAARRRLAHRRVAKALAAVNDGQVDARDGHNEDTRP